jgi:Na+-translocating ferredoxin:NAD+ oxidoreductase RnfA subunit
VRKGRYDTDRIAALFVFVFSAVFLWQLKYVHDHLDVIFPRTILIGMIVLSVVLFVKSFVKASKLFLRFRIEEGFLPVLSELFCGRSSSPGWGLLLRVSLP